jgi:hypothetical protein
MRTSDLPNHLTFCAQHPCRLQNMERMNIFEKNVCSQTFQGLFYFESQSVRPLNKNSKTTKVGTWGFKDSLAFSREDGFQYYLHDMILLPIISAGICRR